MPNKCDLYLENYKDFYKSEQTIVGYVLCTFDSPKDVHGLIVKIKGEAKTSSNEHETYYNSSTEQNETRSVAYTGSDLILSDEIDLLQCNGSEKTIPKGVQKYPFTYTLPKSLPSSFKHKLGKIKYKIKAIVKRPLLKFNYEAESDFIIFTPVNLNEYPSLQASLVKTEEKLTHCCCWRNGNIKVTANIPKAAFLIGEVIPLHVQVENLSRSNIQRILCKVKKDTKFEVTSPGERIRYDKVVLFTDTFAGVGAHGENTYDKVIILNNPSMISNYLDCDIISNTYELELTLVISGLHRKLHLEMPFMIGHIPFGARPNTPSQGQSVNLQEVNPPAYGFVPPPPLYDAVEENQTAPSAPSFNAAPPSTKGTF